MPVPSVKCASWWGGLVSGTLLALAGAPALGQSHGYPNYQPGNCPPPAWPSYTPPYTYPGGTPTVPQTSPGMPSQGMPSQGMPSQGMTGQDMTGQGMTGQAMPQLSAMADTGTPGGAGEPSPTASGLAFGGSTVALSGQGYIDSAIPRSQFRLRYDAAWDDNRPDRAEFFYAKCGCYRNPALAMNPALAALFDPKAPGPNNADFAAARRVDFQDISSYLEIAATDRLSGFVEIPVRFVQFDSNRASPIPSTSGLSDINAGFKFAMIADPCNFLTFQFRAYAPTGAADRGLGTNHASVEPAVLWYQRLTNHLSFFGEFRDWIPIDGTDFAGNVLRYGAGVGYEVYRCRNIWITPSVEFVGWTVLSGKELDATTNATLSAAGDTILNVKAGVRAGLGCHNDFYVGYGRALTGDVWYKDIIRLEYRFSF